MKTIQHVNFDARPGEVISWKGNNYRVIDTYPNQVRLENGNGEQGLVLYAELADDKAFYRAVLNIIA